MPHLRDGLVLLWIAAALVASAADYALAAARVLRAPGRRAPHAGRAAVGQRRRERRKQGLL